MSLREQKKRRTRAAIIENAIALFRERGFDSTRVQDIARPLELSDATFFNYFPTKDGVLTEWVQHLVAGAFLQGAGARSERARVTGRAAARSLAEQIAPDAEFLSALWHRVRLGALSASPGVRDWIAGAQARGELRSDLPAEQLADLLVAGLLVAVGSWLDELAPPGGGTRAVAALGKRMQSVVDLVFDGSRKRNERVAPPPARPPTRPPKGGLSAGSR